MDIVNVGRGFDSMQLNHLDFSLLKQFTEVGAATT